MEITVLRNVFQRNENAARENRRRLDAAGVTCFNLLGGAGSGKTSVLEAVLPLLRESLRMAVLEGDLATTRDAERIAKLNVPVVQLLTEGGCHLTATLVMHALDRVPLDQLDLLVIENVGNPICPANYDLGEHARISVLSVAEGADKPSKYPLLFKDAALVLLTKCDLLPHTDFDAALAEADIRRVSPNCEIIRTDVRRPTGIDRFAAWLLTRRQRSGGP
jgi:hydrogenase nickel incorporation protein HypB